MCAYINCRAARTFAVPGWTLSTRFRLKEAPLPLITNNKTRRSPYPLPSSVPRSLSLPCAPSVPLPPLSICRKKNERGSLRSRRNGSRSVIYEPGVLYPHPARNEFPRISKYYMVVWSLTWLDEPAEFIYGTQFFPPSHISVSGEVAGGARLAVRKRFSGVTADKETRARSSLTVVRPLDRARLTYLKQIIKCTVREWNAGVSGLRA